MQTLRDGGILSVMAFEAINSLGFDAEKVFLKCGVDIGRLQNKNFRTPHAAQQLFWQILEEETGDADIGLHLGQRLPIFKRHILAYLFLSSPTFSDGLAQTVRFLRLLSDAVSATVVICHDEKGDEAYLAYNVSNPLRHTLESGAQSIIAFLNSTTDGAFKPTQIHFPHSSTVSAEKYAAVFGCPVRLEQNSDPQQTRIYFKSELLAMPSNYAEPELFKVHEAIASSHLAKLEMQDAVADVKTAIAELLDSGVVNLKTVAQKLGMKPRMLRNVLYQADTNFNTVVAECRCLLAKQLLGRSNKPMDIIVYQTGFSEPSTFYRAFKRWTGTTPIKYRKKKQDILREAFEYASSVVA